MSKVLVGNRFELHFGEEGYPEQLVGIPDPPKVLYGIGNPAALLPGLAVVGARKATPYGVGCARRFARLAAEKGVIIISGGARGCDSEAHRAALDAGSITVAFLGGGCDRVYPPEHEGLFQRVIDAGGAIVSEYPWQTPPLPYMFRARNRLIAGLAAVVLIVEAGLPSGTFSTADEALEAGREVLVVPGSITSAMSRGANQLLFQGASPVIDDESFEEALFRSCGMLQRPGAKESLAVEVHPIIAAIQAQPTSTDELLRLAQEEFGREEAQVKLMELLVEAEAAKLIARQPNGAWGPTVKWC